MTCGEATVVKVIQADRAILLCLFHKPEAGAMLNLPEMAPDNWEELTIEDVLAKWRDSLS